MNLKENITIYINSFRSKSILLAAALNSLLVLIVAALIVLVKILSKPWTNKLEKINLANVALQTETQLESIAMTLRGFILFVVLAIVILVIILIIKWSFFQGIIYKHFLKKKANMKYLKNFTVLNALWLPPWMALFLAIILGIKADYLIISFYILFLLFLHFTFILYTRFTKNNKLSEIKKTLKIGITKMHYFIVPYILISITFIIILQLNRFNIPYFFVIYIILFSWIQNYTKEIILKV